jgi:hypothetical protein
LELSPGFVWGLLLVALSGCIPTTTNTEHVKELKRERYTLVEPEKPALTSDWRRDGRELVGEVRSAACHVERTWEHAEVEVTRKKPNKTAAQVVGGIGVGLLSFSTSLWYFTDNDKYLVGAGLGLGAMIVSLATPQRSSVKTARSNVEQRTTNESGPCIQRLDSPALELALKLPDGKGVPVKLRADGRATARIPPSYPVPEGELPIVVYRLPDSASGILKRGQVVGTVRWGSP